MALKQRNNELFQENFARSQNEQILFSAWKTAEQEKNAMFDKNKSIARTNGSFVK